MTKKFIAEISENAGNDSWWSLHLYVEIDPEYQDDVESFIKNFNDQNDLVGNGSIGSKLLQDFLSQLRAFPYVIQAEIAEYFNPLA